MKKAPPVRLSLRKLMVAMLAVGPLAILPAPLLAVVPLTTAVPFDVLNGSATYSGSTLVNNVQVGSLGNISMPVSNVILAWKNNGNTAQSLLSIAAGDTYNFQFTNQSGGVVGAVLNKTGYTTAGLIPSDVVIAGNLQSNGRVFILANGNITIGGGAQINTQGLVLSTLQETDNFTFIGTGNLANTGSSTGSIQIGNSTTALNVVGSLGAYSGNIALNNVVVTGDVILNQSKSAPLAAPLMLSGANGPTTVSGNLTVITNNTTVNQTVGTAVTANVLSLTTGNQTATLNGANQFTTVMATGAGLSVTDVDNINIGASTLGVNGLIVTAAGNINTIGTVTTTSAGNVSLTSNTSGSINFGNNGSISGQFTGGAAAGNVTVTVPGALSLGAISAPANTVTATSNSVVTIAGAVSGGTVTINGTSIASTGGTVSTSAGAASFTSTAGGITLPNISAQRVLATTSGGSITQGTGTTLVTLAAGQTSGFNAGTGAVSLTNANNVFASAGGATPSIVEFLASSVALTLGNNTANSGVITIGAANVTGSVTVNTTAAGSGAGKVTLGAGAGTIASNMNIGGSLNVTTNNSSVSEDAASENLVQGSVNIVTGTGTTGAGTVTFGAAATENGGGRYGQFNVSAPGAAITLNENTALNLGTITGSDIVTRSINSDILINGPITGATFSARASSGGIIEGASGSINLTGLSTFNSSNSFGTNLSNTSNVFGDKLTLMNGGNNIITTNSTLILTPGNVTGGSVTINQVTPGLLTNLTAGNATDVRINAAGPISLNSVLVRNLTLNTTDTSTNAIRQVGNLTANGTVTLTSSGGIVLNNATNNITGSVVLSNVALDSTIYSSRNLTISGTSSGNLTAIAGTSTTNSFANAWNVILGNLSVNNLYARAMNSGSAIGNLGAVTVGNGGTGYAAATVTFSAPDIPGGTAAVGTATVTGGVITGITITNSPTGYLNPPTVTITGANTTAATNITVAFGSANATSGNSGNISQSNNARLHVEGTADFTTFGGNVAVGNNGNSFGRVQASTGGATGVVGGGSITIVEDSGLRVGNVATNATASLTSRFGPILEDDRAPVNITVNGTGSGLTLSAPASSIQLGNATLTTTGNITAASMTAAGSAQLYSTGDITLGATSANSLAITANSISQSAPLNIFGLSSFTATGNNATTLVGGAITLTNSANNFGPVALTANKNGNIAVTEANTLNLRSIAMGDTGNSTSNGTLTLMSVNGDIIDTGLAGVKFGGLVSTTANVTVQGSGIVSLTATNGNIVIDDSTSDVVTSGGLAFNSNNVTLQVLSRPGATLNLGVNGTSSVAHGNLTVSSALGNIGNAGSFHVDNVASFSTGNGNITINQPNTGFGSLRFLGNQVQITEAGNMDILTGSSAFGPALLISGGSINVLPGTGTVTFGNSVNMNAVNDITLRQTQVVGTLTLTHGGTANLSALSKSTDLNSRDPIDLGTGPYVAPNQ